MGGNVHSTTKRPERLSYLNSIRGIAALTVVLCHCWLLSSAAFAKEHVGLSNAFSSMANLLFYSLSKLNEAGGAAVILFFVLSGFVLALSLRQTPVPYLSYALRQFFRIYPAFLFIVVASYALHLIIGVRVPSISSWINIEVNSPNLSSATLLKHLALWGTTESHGLDIVIWSLVHEMRISLLFPFILSSVIASRIKSVLVWWLVSIICSVWILFTTGTIIEGTQTSSFVDGLFATVFFIVFFAVGALLAVERERVSAWIGALSKWKILILFLVAAYCLLKSDFSHYALIGSINDYLRGVGAVGLIALALGVPNFRNVLYHSSLRWLGRVSYSLYLVHIPVLYEIGQTVGKSWSVLQVSILTVAISLLAAEIIARAIEFPSIRLGKELGRWAVKSDIPISKSV